MLISDMQDTLNLLDTLGVNYELTVRAKQNVSRIWISAVKETNENYRPILSSLTTLFGRLNKEISNGIQSWEASKDHTQLMMYRVATCKVVGYRTVERKVTKEIETDEVEQEEVPIYDCSETE